MRAAIAWLGLSQTVYWGIAYYAYSVLLVPMREAFGASDAAVAGAFSLGLGVSAVLAVRVGRALDANAGARLIRAGGWVGPLVLLAWSFVSGLIGLYAVWFCFGVVMALVLYETAFALATRAIADPSRRLAALASVTVFGGCASSVFLPLTAAMVAHTDWRITLRVFAVLWLLVALGLARFGLPALTPDASAALAPSIERAPSRKQVWLAGAPFVFAIFAGMAVTTLVIPSLVDQGVSLEHASWVLAALGITQLPGRLWFWRARPDTLSPSVFLLSPLLLQGSGLLVLGVAHSLWAAFAGVALFGLGAGLHTLARPWLVPLLFGVNATGRVNGAIARGQALARAAGPFAAAFAYGRIGSAWVFVGLGAGVLALCPLARWAARRTVLTEAPAGS